MRQLDKLTSRWTWVSGMRFHVRVPRGYQDPSAPAVVLVHGVGVSSRYMAPLAAVLAPHTRVYAPDLPGFGLSSKPPEPLGIERLADELAKWMDAEGLERAVIIGNSVGCQVATELAVRHPERVIALVLQGPTMDEHARNVLRQIRRWLKVGTMEPRSLSLVLLRDYLDCGIGRLWQTFKMALKHPLEERVSHVKVPTLVVRGSNDSVVPERWCEKLVERLPAGRLSVVPGPAHTLNYAAAEPLGRVLLPFINSWSRAPRPLLKA